MNYILPVLFAQTMEWQGQMQLSEWPEQEKPREKLMQRGASTLSDAELLAIFLRTGVKGANVVELARQLLRHFGSLRALFSASEQDFCRTKGLGKAKYAQMQAILEMSKRYLAESLVRESAFTRSEQTRNYLMSELRDEPNEVFAMLSLDSQHRLIRFNRLFFGTIDSASVHPRVVLQTALKDNAAAIIVAHNHPSGIAEPSESDRSITKRIVNTMQLVDIAVLDHLVIGDGYAISFAERGWL